MSYHLLFAVVHSSFSISLNSPMPGVLEAWKLESELQNFCDKTEGLQPAELLRLQSCIQRAEETAFSSHVHPVIFKQASRRLSSKLGKQVGFNLR